MTSDATMNVLQNGRLGVLVTIKKDGRPQLSNVSYIYDPATNVIRISVTDDRAKTRNLRRDPRASFYVANADGNTYVVAEGTVELTAVAADPQDAVVDELVEHFRSVRGSEHPDWDEFREAMVSQRRLLVRLPVDRTYGLSQ
ncbi:MAG TPA: PPOX class F420-dependent oxidoreductase [Micromonosporaceae bacterium]|jgi:PPOX class probable F420-dependent enzyme